MSEAVIVAIWNGVPLVAVAIITAVTAAIANRGRQHAKATREQVENSHDTNLRDEMDERHAENTGRLETIESLTDWQAKHQAQSDRGYRRLLRLELMTTPALLAVAVYAIATLRKGNRP